MLSGGKRLTYWKKKMEQRTKHYFSRESNKINRIPTLVCLKPSSDFQHVRLWAIWSIHFILWSCYVPVSWCNSQRWWWSVWKENQIKPKKISSVCPAPFFFFLFNCFPGEGFGNTHSCLVALPMTQKVIQKASTLVRKTVSDFRVCRIAKI